MTTTITPSSPPAGWYADATGPGMHYWDGEGWTDRETTTSGVLSRGSVRWAAALAAAAAEPLWRRRWVIPIAVVIVVIAGGFVLKGILPSPHQAGAQNAVLAKDGHAKDSHRSPSAASQPTLTASQKHAERSARNYLDVGAYSRTSLIGQLRLDGYSRSDSLFAANDVVADWNAEAVEAAKAYLTLTSFSHQGLIDALTSEGFTLPQAVYGVHETSVLASSGRPSG